jgi:hypothetical protein
MREVDRQVITVDFSQKLIGLQSNRNGTWEHDHTPEYPVEQDMFFAGETHAQFTVALFERVESTPQEFLDDELVKYNARHTNEVLVAASPRILYAYGLCSAQQVEYCSSIDAHGQTHQGKNLPKMYCVCYIKDSTLYFTHWQFEKQQAHKVLLVVK